MTAVIVRSYSRTIDHTSLEQKTWMSGAATRMMSRARLLMRGVAVGVDEGEHDTLGASALGRLQRRQHAGLVHGLIDPAVGQHALAHAQHHVLGNERRSRAPTADRTGRVP